MPPMTNFDPLAALVGGALIGAAAVYLLLFSGLIAGISGIMRRLVSPWDGGMPPASSAFLVGLVAAPLVWTATTGVAVAQSIPPSLPLAVVSGLLVGFGAVHSGGCTSGHGVCGLARFSKRSLIAVLVFVAAAMVTVYIARHVIGG